MKQTKRFSTKIIRLILHLQPVSFWFFDKAEKFSYDFRISYSTNDGFCKRKIFHESTNWNRNPLHQPTKEYVFLHFRRYFQNNCIEKIEIEKNFAG